MEPVITLDHVCKRFGEYTAVHEANFAIGKGEFFSLLGPSGCGKTTTLRMIAGFEQPDTGRILLEGQDVSRVPPFRRNVNTVFQHYALFPHMSVRNNIAFGPRSRKLPPSEVTRRVDEALASTRLTTFADREPSQLSGGQQQRVALARALVNYPSALLLDEPLGALDLKLRQAMQIELKALQQQVGITFVYVTHDQEEALTMSDRLAVFNQGKIEQIGSPAEIYERPGTAFVAGFVGVSNLVSGDAARAITGSPATFAIRPEKIHMSPPETPLRGDMLAADGTIEEVIYLGMYTRYVVALDQGGELTVVEQNLRTTSMDVLSARGQRVRLMWESQHNREIEG